MSLEYNPDYLVFLDLETTGLDIHKDHIIEMAALIVDTKELKVRSSYTGVVKPDDEAGYLQRLKENPVALEMHQANGLLEKIEQVGCTIEHAIEMVSRCMDKYAVGKSTLPLQMAGACVSCFDLPLLKTQYPDFAAKFHYRTVDVSVLRSEVDTWRPGITSDPGYPPAPTSHRAMSDCMASLDLLKFYRRIFS